LTFITDPRNSKNYLAVGHTRQISLWDTDTIQCVKIFDVALAPNKAATKLHNYHDWTHIFVSFDHVEQPILIGGTTRGCFCWNFDTTALVYEKKFDSVNPKRSDEKVGTIKANKAINNFILIMYAIILFVAFRQNEIAYGKQVF